MATVYRFLLPAPALHPWGTTGRRQAGGSPRFGDAQVFPSSVCFLPSLLLPPMTLAGWEQVLAGGTYTPWLLLSPAKSSSLAAGSLVPAAGAEQVGFSGFPHAYVNQG